MNEHKEIGTINNLVIKDLDYSEDYGVRIFAEPPEWMQNYGANGELEEEYEFIISYEAVVLMYQSLFVNHPGYPEVYGEVEVD